MSAPETPSAPAYAEMLAASNFSFLRAGSGPEELVGAAMALGLSGLALCDRNSFAGVVRGYVALRNTPEPAPRFRYIVGVRLCFADGTPDLIAYPSTRLAYGRLCKLLTRANQRGAKGKPILYFSDLFGTGDPAQNMVHGPSENFAQGQLFVLVPDEADWSRTETVLAHLHNAVPGNVWVAGTVRYAGNDRARLARLHDLAQRHHVPLIAVNDVLYHEPARRILQDVVTCIREHLTLETAGRRLEANAERHLKSPAEMVRLFALYPDAITQTQTLLGRISFSLDQLRYNYPEETVGDGETTQQTLERLTWEGAEKRYPDGMPNILKKQLWTELCLIAYKGYAAYFLTVQDIVRFAREERGILCQGRGSAANSAVCFCLGVTSVNPLTAELVFGRFISTERDEPPDIDVDFEHERREEVMQYVYAKYGGKRTGLTANVITYRSKSAIRETCKVFGISDDMIAALNQLHWGWSSTVADKTVRELGLDPDDRTLKMALEVARTLRGFPRHLSQHVGGFVITRDSLESLVPISKTAMDSRMIIEWNKDDIDALAILKVDVLALGMLTCLQKAFGLLRDHYGQEVSIDSLMQEEADEAIKAPVYAMIQRADTIGVFQIESRAQMSMLPRLKPKKFYDLVIEVAIVRPGPIQGGMVHPYLKRRDKLEAPEVDPTGKLDAVLERTLGIPLFQEQAMQIAVVGAGFSPGEADQLRRAMAAWRRTGRIAIFEKRFLDGMKTSGYGDDFAQRCFAQIKGFAEYGFPESHAASFALLVYASCWLKCHYPDVFAVALLNSQPMGFYAPSQLIRDASEHGVDVRPVDINLSVSDHGLEVLDGEDERWAGEHVWPQHASMRDHIQSRKAVRLGFRSITGLSQAAQERILACRSKGYDSVRDVWLRTGLSPAILEKLAYADAFSDSLGLTRRDAIWAVRGLVGTHGADTLPLFSSAGLVATTLETGADLPPMPPGEQVIHDYRSLSFSLKGHPVGFLRPQLAARRIVPSIDLSNAPAGHMVEVAGLVLVRQRPGTAKGVIFATLEDETGIANVVIWSKVFEANRRTILSARMLAVRGQLQREGLVIHIVAKEFIDMTPMLLELADGHDIGQAMVSRGDEGKSGPSPGRDREAMLHIETARRQAYAALPGGRNFH